MTFSAALLSSLYSIKKENLRWFVTKGFIKKLSFATSAGAKSGAPTSTQVANRRCIATAPTQSSYRPGMTKEETRSIGSDLVQTKDRHLGAKGLRARCRSSTPGIY